MTTSEVAEEAHVDASTVRHWVRRGVLVPRVTTPGGHHRFDPEDVRALLGNDEHDEPSAVNI